MLYSLVCSSFQIPYISGITIFNKCALLILPVFVSVRLSFWGPRVGPRLQARLIRVGIQRPILLQSKKTFPPGSLALSHWICNQRLQVTKCRIGAAVIGKKGNWHVGLSVAEVLKGFLFNVLFALEKIGSLFELERIQCFARVCGSCVEGCVVGASVVRRNPLLNSSHFQHDPCVCLAKFRIGKTKGFPARFH